MVTGRCPYNLNTHSEFEISQAIIQKNLPHPKNFQKNCTDKIYTIIQKCTAKNPNHRYSSCEAIKKGYFYRIILNYFIHRLLIKKMIEKKNLIFLKKKVCHGKL
ncbi:MAG: hypothetical protein KatS3mg035_1263 [Bacteroidia bacterium]|nr:MAG: hypothetical protein KatS3mg035_1263 [Bacteroidia bacterium]